MESTLKMAGGEISVPCAGTVEEVKEVWKRQINEGVFTVREECAPREVTTLSTQGGEVVTQACTIHSRKVPLKCMGTNFRNFTSPICVCSQMTSSIPCPKLMQ